MILWAGIPGEARANPTFPPAKLCGPLQHISAQLLRLRKKPWDQKGALQQYPGGKRGKAPGGWGFWTRVRCSGSPEAYSSGSVRPRGRRQDPDRGGKWHVQSRVPARLTCICLRSRGPRQRAPARKRAASTAMVTERRAETSKAPRERLNALYRAVRCS